jgi:hypothetical protein
MNLSTGLFEMSGFWSIITSILIPVAIKNTAKYVKIIEMTNTLSRARVFSTRYPVT